MRVIFLDIDGVLASLDWIRTIHALKERHPDSYGYSFDPRCVKNLEYIIKHMPEVRIVISSSWKGMGGPSLCHMWNIRNLPGVIVGTTPDLLRTPKDSSRGLEIQKWLEINDNIDSYVIIDDDSDMLPGQMDNFIKTDAEIGLTLKDSSKALAILRREKQAAA